MKRSLMFAAVMIVLGSTSAAKADAFCYVPDPLTAFLDRIFGNVCYAPPPPMMVQPAPVPAPMPMPMPGAGPVPMPIPGRPMPGGRPMLPPPRAFTVPGPIYDCPMRAVPYPWSPTGYQYVPYC